MIPNKADIILYIYYIIVLMILNKTDTIILINYILSVIICNIMTYKYD